MRWMVISISQTKPVKPLDNPRTWKAAGIASVSTVPSTRASATSRISAFETLLLYI